MEKVMCSAAAVIKYRMCRAKVKASRFWLRYIASLRACR